MVSRYRPTAVLLLLGCAFGALAGCTSTRTEIDSVTFGAGNAMHHNRVVHTVDPWPKYAWQVDLQTNADRSPLLRDRAQTANPSATPSAGANGSAQQESATEPN